MSDVVEVGVDQIVGKLHSGGCDGVRHELEGLTVTNAFFSDVFIQALTRVATRGLASGPSSTTAALRRRARLQIVPMPALARCYTAFTLLLGLAYITPKAVFQYPPEGQDRRHMGCAICLSLTQYKHL
eukprot:239261-Pleurochrysis_carterae.AAC.2